MNEEQVTLVEIIGEVDTNTAPLIQERILPLAQAGIKMILEMTKVPYMSSAGLRMLLSLYRQISAQEGKIVLVGLSEEIQDTMSITGFLEFFNTCDTIDLAFAALNVQVPSLK
ncbi:anti-sigma factor antagonist [Iningainema sp. BLCCT55]|uniref:Anti-sigma factor antagonist n=2 Tax=Iningainema TaxID=1932705 RepID=A0A8J7BXQ8_9CYAN|nr:anti-sigma factor antagonist [Iningainema tapete BLCC-T55]